MRIFWTSLIIIFVFMTLSIYFIHDIKKTSASIVINIEEIEKKMCGNDWEEMQEDINGIRKKWEELTSLWSIFVEHSELDDIQISLLKASEYISMNNDVLARAELSVLKYLVRHIYLKQKLELGNIF